MDPARTWEFSESDQIADIAILACHVLQILLSNWATYNM
jgi:hypothetical protein